MPQRQKLLGIWMLATGILLFAGIFCALWLDAQIKPDAATRLVIWAASLSSGMLLLLLGVLLEGSLFKPLRHLQVQLARLVSNPDALDDYPPEGWLESLQPDLQRLRQGWRQDRALLGEARMQGAKDAARIRQELEALLQVLKVPLLLCDRHQRLLLFNPAAEELFADNPALGLGRRLEELLPAPSLKDALRHLPRDGSARQLLLPHQGRWYLCDLRRVLASQGEALLTLEDATERQKSDQRWRKPMASLLPALRGHAANLATAGEILSSGGTTPELDQRLQTAMHEDSQALSNLIGELAQLLETLQLDQGQLSDTWSNDIWQALKPGLEEQGLTLTPIGIPLWLRADSPGLLALLQRLLLLLNQHTGLQDFEAEIQLGNNRVYLDLIWQGEPLSLRQLQQWNDMPIADEALSPRLGDILRRHSSDWWSLTDADDLHARLRMPLPAARRVYPPLPQVGARPEFHDFSIADLPPPSIELRALPLNQLEMVVFDTETTGLNLRDGDRIISIGGCRIINGRLLAQEVFDQKVNPGRAIPPASTRIHGLTDADVEKSPPASVVLPRFREFVGNGVLVAHNASFDLLAVTLEGSGLSFDMPILDTLLLSRGVDPQQEGHGLDELAERFQLTFPPGTRHTALGDARVTAELLLALLPRLEARGIHTLNDALMLQAEVENRGKK
ncbi:3'-5' exonuclease [Marinospirillum alkaliphilum]|uniref:DNA-directed DNA polymerase n=1 Tax=Marinospirillum alkaliphilum DSM 21637 TaxID=1122209 RepID=A0A1K1UG64_9GAMM|nr:exonuclease domain-containing protein [Marinospirillum alkaliphilum]SFX11403.1 DNA polymerase-3 subunit epsilon [Marinospirillum alkaliphilum DSM 21637]